MIEVALCQRISPVAATSGIEHVGHQHDVVVGSKLDVAQRENLQVVFQVLADLEDAGVFQQRLHGGEGRGLLDLVRRDRPGEQAIAATVAALAMGERHVASLVRRDRERDAAQRGLHGVETVGLGIERNHAAVARARDPGVEPVEAAHDLVARTVDLGVAGGLDTRGGERLRGQLNVFDGGRSFLARSRAFVIERQARGGEQIAGLAGRRRLCPRGGN